VFAKEGEHSLPRVFGGRVVLAEPVTS